MKDRFLASTRDMATALRALAADLEAADPVDLPNVTLRVDVVGSASGTTDETIRITAARQVGEALGVRVREYADANGFRHYGTPGQRRHRAEVSIYIPLTSVTGAPLIAAVKAA